MTLFVEGEPLDVSKLNKLATDISSLSTKLKSTMATSNNTAQITVSQSGVQQLSGIGTTISSEIPVQLKSGIFNYLDANNPVIVTATVQGKMEGVVALTISKNPDSSNTFTIQAVSTKVEKGLKVNWIAVQNKIINL
jgi:hypothetical protein